jgi:acyl carrier protein
MNTDQIYDIVILVFRRIIDPRIEVNAGTASRDVHNWDSLNHVMFIAEVEKTFGIRFELTDMLEMRTIGDICRGVEKQLNSK